MVQSQPIAQSKASTMTNLETETESITPVVSQIAPTLQSAPSAAQLEQSIASQVEAAVRLERKRIARFIKLVRDRSYIGTEAKLALSRVASLVRSGDYVNDSDVKREEGDRDG